MPRQARKSSGTGIYHVMSIIASIGEIDRHWEKHDLSYVMKQEPVPVFPAP